ncbi:MAG: hypothetical protein VX340_11590 [Pseudomonadota bacterium]|nr:hypothetical protein [Pseudomonadota bacterium]
MVDGGPSRDLARLFSDHPRLWPDRLGSANNDGPHDLHIVLYHIHILREGLELGVRPAAALAGFKLILYQILLGTYQAALLQPPSP